MEMSSNKLTLRSAADLVQSRKHEFARALAGRINPDVFEKISISALAKNPALLECTPSSLIMAFADCAALGLEPAGAMADAYVLPYNNKGTKEAQLQISYRGLVKLAVRGGSVLNIVPRTVYENDVFELSLGLKEQLVHLPTRPGRDPGDMIAFYAVAKMKSGRDEFWVRDKAHVERIRSMSRAKNAGPWADHYEAMAWKTVIREFIKYLPTESPELSLAVDIDDQAAVLPDDRHRVVHEAPAPIDPFEEAQQNSRPESEAPSSHPDTLL